MAYSAAVSWEMSTISGHRHLRIKVVETEARDTSEWSTRHTAVTNVVTDADGNTGADVPVFPVGTITLMQSTLESGTGSTIRPRLGKSTGWPDDTQAEITHQTDAASHFDDQEPVRYSFDPTATLRMYGKSTVDTTTSDNRIVTLLEIVEGHFGAVNTPAAADAGIDFSAGIELDDETEVALSLGVAADDFVTIDTRAGSERVNSLVPAYVETDTLDLRIGGELFNDRTGSDTILGTNEVRSPFLRSAAAIGRAIPAGSLEVGSRIRFRAAGMSPVAGDGTDTFTLDFALGTVAIVTTSSGMNPATGDGWLIEGEVVVWTLGAPGTCAAFARFQQASRGAASQPFLLFSGSGNSTPSKALDTTIDNLPAIYITRAAGSGDTNSIQMFEFSVDVLPPRVAAA